MLLLFKFEEVYKYELINPVNNSYVVQFSAMAWHALSIVHCEQMSYTFILKPQLQTNKNLITPKKKTYGNLVGTSFDVMWQEERIC
jgi:hypothetical protein